jgi:hypothetical protein
MPLNFPSSPSIGQIYIGPGGESWQWIGSSWKSITTFGTSGSSGSSGSSGTSGTDGTSGSSGTSGTSGTSGSSGTSGVDGIIGIAGNDGSNSGRWNFNLAAVAPADPGRDQFSANNTLIGGTGKLSISTTDVNSVNYYDWLDAIRNRIQLGHVGYLQITEVGSNSNIGIWEITVVDDNTLYFDFTISSIVSTAGYDWINRATYTISWVFNGLDGTIGAAGSSGTSGAAGTSGTSGTSSISTRSFGITIDGGGAAITTGIKGEVVIPVSMTITGWTIVADQVGSIQIDVWKDSYANFPPIAADSIAGTELPTLSSQDKNQDNSLTTWTTLLVAGDVIRFNVDSASTVTRVTLSIYGN